MPRNSILEVKEDPKLKQLMEKFREPSAKILERIDYEKENTDCDGKTDDVPQVNSVDAIAEETEPTDEIVRINCLFFINTVFDRIFIIED